MSLLSQQLQKIKNTQRALKVGPHQQQPTLILDQHTATSTSQDLIYTMAIISYSKLLTAQPSLRLQGQIVMADSNREINRNILTKDSNRELSQKLIKFLLKLSPFFLTTDCQKVIEYLLNNYKINHFQAEAMAIIYLQYWNTPIYVKLISNIPEKILASKLSFLGKLKTEAINITYIVKNLVYSHYLISALLLYTLEYLKFETTDAITMDVQINLGDEVTDTEPTENLIRCDPRRFLLQVFSELINRKLTTSYKYVIEFCGKAVQLKHQSSETVSMVMLLSTRLLLEDSISDELLFNLLLKLLKKMQLFSQKTIRSLFDFTLIIWQRRPSCIKKEALYYLQDHEKFINYLSNFKCSLWMILIRLIELYLEGSQCGQLISCIGPRLKRDQFYEMYSEQYNKRLFQLFEYAFSLENGDHIQFIAKFIQENYLHEAANHYNGKAIANDSQFKQLLLSLFPKNLYKLNEKGVITFNVALIPKKTPTAAKKQKKQLEKIKNESGQSDAQEKKPTESSQRHSLLEKLRRSGLEIEQINFQDIKIKETLTQLVNDYYTQRINSPNEPVNSILSHKQKSSILDHYPELYNEKYLEVDLKENNFILPIKYLTTHQDISSSKICILFLENNISLIDDVLFRELLRLSLEQISFGLNSEYKSIIYFINTLFKKLLNKYLAQSGENIELLKLSELLLKISEALFSKDGTKRGKYHRILHNHGKVIAELLLRVKSKKRVVKDLNNEQTTILQHYIRTIHIFKAENIYLLNIAIIESLTKKELDHSQIRSFINLIIRGSLTQSAFDHYTLAVSIIKTIVFCSQLGTIKVAESEIDPSFSSGIAKNVIADFFGLVKDKFKRVITKKLLLYIRSIFQNTYIVEHFKNELVELSKNHLSEVLSVYTELYRILGVLQSEEKQISSFRETIMDKVTNIFPFDLRIALFEPLLPDQHLYKYLGEQLAEHKAERSQFQQLSSLVSIVPTSVSSEWVHFMKECLRRGYYPDEQHISAIFENNIEGDISNYAQYICALAEFCPETLHPHLEKSVQIIEGHCADPNDFTLAIISKMIRSLGELLEPYLSQLLHVSLGITSNYIDQFIEDITEHLVTPTLIKIIRTEAKEATNLSNFSLFFKRVATKGVGDSLNKTLLSFMNRTLIQLAEGEENPEAIVKLQAQVFLEISLKMNENQLRKIIIDLVRWSETKTEIEEKLPFNLRKLTVSQIFSLLSESLQGLFNPFFGYIFESFLKDYQNITSATIESKQKAKLATSDKKRSREEIKEYHEDLIELYLKISLHCLELLFKNDTDHQFLDSFKIESLGDPLSELLLLSQVERYSSLVSGGLISCLVAFHQSISDDYQMKTMNLKIMVLLKNKNTKIHKAVFELTDKLIDELKDRFLLLVNDLIPFLLESAGSRHEGVSKLVRKIIAKIEELSGEEIQNYVK